MIRMCQSFAQPATIRNGQEHNAYLGTGRQLQVLMRWLLRRPTPALTIRTYPTVRYASWILGT